MGNNNFKVSIETLLARTPLTSYPFHNGYTCVKPCKSLLTSLSVHVLLYCARAFVHEQMCAHVAYILTEVGRYLNCFAGDRYMIVPLNPNQMGWCIVVAMLVKCDLNSK